VCVFEGWSSARGRRAGEGGRSIRFDSIPFGSKHRSWVVVVVTFVRARWSAACFGRRMANGGESAAAGGLAEDARGARASERKGDETDVFVVSLSLFSRRRRSSLRGGLRVGLDAHFFPPLVPGLGSALGASAAASSG